MAEYEGRELGWDEEVEKGKAGIISSFLPEIMILRWKHSSGQDLRVVRKLRPAIRR